MKRGWFRAAGLACTAAVFLLAAGAASPAQAREGDAVQWLDDFADIAPWELVASEDVKALRETVQGLADAVATLRQSFQAMQPGQAPEPILPDLADEEIETAIAEGKGAQAIRRAVEARIQRAVREHVTPLQQQVQGTGMAAIAALAIEAVRPQLKHYDRYKKEIDEALAAVGAEHRMNPQTIRAAHDIVVGRHLQEIVTEEVEKAVRGKRENPTGTPGTTAAGRHQTETKVPSALELFGKDAGQAVRDKGGEDTYAKRLGYESWADYLTKTGVEGEA